MTERGIRTIRAVFFISIATLLVVAAAGWLVPKAHNMPPAPAFKYDPVNPESRDLLLAYARSLAYDSVTHGTADSTILTETDSSGRSITRSVAARVASQVNAHSNRLANLEGTGPGNGRIVARIWIDPTEGRGWPALQLPPGISYIWVDSLLSTSDTSGTARAIIISERERDQVRILPQRIEWLSSSWATMNFPMARWLTRGNGQCANVACTHGCCLVCPSSGGKKP